jgi:hypothetical protein
VPALCGYEGWAIFADASDMVCRADIAELWALRDERYAVQVVKHDYRTKHHRKYVGTEMECANLDYPRKNWSSLILWNCGHPQNRILTPENVREWSGQQLHGFGWLPDDLIGALPIEWNWLAQEHGTNARRRSSTTPPASRRLRPTPAARIRRTGSMRRPRCTARPRP